MVPLTESVELMSARMILVSVTSATVLEELSEFSSPSLPAGCFEQASRLSRVRTIAPRYSVKQKDERVVGMGNYF